MKTKLVLILSIILSAFTLFAQKITPVKNEEGKWGYKNESDELVIQYKYDNAWYFDKGLAKVNKDNKYGFIDKTGKKIIPCKYDEIWGFKESGAFIPYSTKYSHVCVLLNNKWGLVNKNGKEITSYIYDFMYVYDNGYVEVEKYGKTGVIDTTGKVVIPIIFDKLKDIFEDQAKLKKNGKLYYIAIGEEVLDQVYNEINDFSDGLAIVAIDDMYGYIDKDNSEVIPLIYDSAADFNNGKARVTKKGKTFYIDKLGKCVEDCPE